MPSILTRPSGGGAAPAPSGGYVPPSDWLDLPTVNEGENKLAGIVAVWDISNNYITVRATTDSGTWSVDWGDGNTTTGISSGTTAEHKLSYAGATGSLTTRGYKTAAVVVTADTGNFTTLDLIERHSEATQRYYAPWLNIKMAAPSLTSLDVYSTSTEVFMDFLEQFDYVGGNAITNGDNYFRNIQSLKSIVNFDTSNMTTMDNFFGGLNQLTPIIQGFKVDTSAATSLQSAFQYYNAQILELTGTSQITAANGLFTAFTNAMASEIIIDNTGIGSANSVYLCFSNTPNLAKTPDLGDTSGIVQWLQFCDGSGIKVMSAHDLSGATNMTNWVRNCNNLSRILAFGATITHSIANCNLDVDAMEEYATNLGDGTGQTLTTSGNPASGSWDTTIATAKNWTVVD